MLCGWGVKAGMACLQVKLCYAISERFRKCIQYLKELYKRPGLLPAALRAAQACRYLVYSEADFEVFRPAGATRCTDGGEMWRSGPKVTFSMPNFTPIGATTRV